MFSWVRIPRRLASFDSALFALALAIFLGTRLIGLERFPIYFFSDEAIQSVSAASFLHNGLSDGFGHHLPTFFQNAGIFSLDTSVYAQIVPYALFGYSEYATRGTSVLIAFFGMVAVGLTLRDVFKIRFWWVGVLLLSATPAWFLHSRTAFEAVLGTSFYCWFLYAYFRYRTGGAPRFLYTAAVFAALTFYSYHAFELTIVVTAVLLVLSDARFHWLNRRTALRGLLLVMVLAGPYIRFRIQQPGDFSRQLHVFDSYWVDPQLSFGDKVARFWQRYWAGLDPRYWYGRHNSRDLIRHVMNGWGNIVPATLPFAAVGLAACLVRIRSAPHRALLLAAAVAPVGGALAEVNVLRALCFVVPVAVITAIGVSAVLTPLLRRIHYAYVAGAIFGALAALNFALLHDALANGPTWYENYGLYGLQYGGRQVSAAVKGYVDRHPDSTVVISPDWANGTDTIIHFFLPHERRVTLDSLHSFLQQRRSLPDLLVLTPEEYARAVRSPKLAGIRIEQTLPYPDDRPGFYFVHMHYSARADAIFAREERVRRQPVVESVPIDGERAKVLHSRFDIGRTQNMFDGDDFTLARTLEADPALVQISLARARALRRITVKAASVDIRVRLSVFREGNPRLLVRSATAHSARGSTTVEFALGSVPVREVKLEVGDQDWSRPGHIHIREITFG